MPRERFGSLRLKHLRFKHTKADARVEISLLELLLPIARVLVRSGTGIDKLARAAKRAYLRAAVDAVLPTGQRINISRLSVATGMTRKEISTLLKDAHAKENWEAISRNRGEQRALRVLRGWLTDPRFQNRSGRAGALSYRGTPKSFVDLVKLYGGDVTPKSVQRELERMGLVEATQAGTLRLRTIRKRRSIEAYQLADLAKLFEDFAFAVVGPKPNSEPSSFFGFKDSTVASTNDAAFFLRRFAPRAAALLEDFQEWSSGRRQPSNSASQDKETIRVGLGVYLLTSDQLSTPGGVGYPNARGAPCPTPTSKRRR